LDRFINRLDLVEYRLRVFKEKIDELKHSDTTNKTYKTFHNANEKLKLWFMGWWGISKDTENISNNIKFPKFWERGGHLETRGFSNFKQKRKAEYLSMS
jgi:hypothetical protein